MSTMGVDNLTNAAGSGSPAFPNGVGIDPTTMSNANATALGLKQYLADGTTYNGGNAITIGGTAYTSTVRGVFVPYQMQDGTWRCRFNLVVVVTGDGNITVSSMVAKNVANAYQSINGDSPDGGSDTTTCTIAPNTNQITFSHTVGIAGDHFCMDGDIELNAKPNWAY